MTAHNEKRPIPSHIKVSASVMLVTPTQARRWLDQNIENNRSVRLRHVAWLAEAMRRGEWRLNGETVVIADTGKLLDGQHRLLAIETSDEPQWMVVVTGVDEKEAFLTIDRGIDRQMKDQLHFLGIHNSAKMASLVRAIITSERGLHTAALRKPHDDEIRDRIEKEHDALQDILSVIDSKAARSVFGKVPAWAGAVIYITRATNRGLADLWLQGLLSGANLSERHPILLLRDRLKDAVGASRTAAMVKPMVREALCYKSFAKFASGVERIGFLKWTEDEPWPVYDGRVVGIDDDKNSD